MEMKQSRMITENKVKLYLRVRSVMIGMCMGIFILSVYACSFEARGIPAREYVSNVQNQDRQSNEKRAVEKQQIAEMSSATENSVFTEKRGIPEYKIGADDVLLIRSMEGNQVQEYETVVRPDGKISYSFIDDVMVDGRTAGEVDDLLTNALKKYIKTPRIEVMIKDYKSKSALLLGQINSADYRASGPGTYYLKGKTTLIDLITMAGGAISGQEYANADLRHVEVVRKGRKYTVNLLDVMVKGDTSQNIVVDSGDIVTVPELPVYGERVYVFGEVASQGIYRLKDAHDLLAAVSLAGGTTRIAVDTDIKVIRGYVANDRKPLVISANLDEVLKQGDISQNIALLNGDVVYVPRTVIGDINEFITNTVPLLDYFLYPGSYRDSYFNSDHLRFKRVD